jgi:hypothetical protein
MTDLEKMFLDAKVVHLMGQEGHVHSLKANLLSKPQEKKKSGFCVEMGEK